jgi:hypothetical protein
MRIQARQVGVSKPRASLEQAGKPQPTKATKLLSFDLVTARHGTGLEKTSKMCLILCRCRSCIPWTQSSLQTPRSIAQSLPSPLSNPSLS